jgi:hypothetical protein
MPAGCVEFERRLRGCPARAEAVNQSPRIGIARHAGRQALRAFQNRLRSGEAIFRQAGGGKAGCRGMGGVKLLRIRRVPQEFPEAGGLGSR